MWKLSALTLLWALSVAAVRLGDEEFSRIPGGLFYVFGSEAIDIVDPTTLRVVKTITRDQDGQRLTNAEGQPRLWNDVVYAEDDDTGERYLFANEGDIYGRGTANPFSYVTVVDVNRQEIVRRIRVRPNPVHSYSVSTLGEIWVHSDANATFDVIAVGNLSLAAQPVPALRRVAAHGKLLWDPELLPLGYATNVGEQYVYEINLEERTLANTYDFSADVPSDGSCVGTHSIQYSARNNHLFVECVGTGGRPSAGVFEWDTVSKQMVELWENSTGSMSALPMEEYIVVANKGRNRASVFFANGGGQDSTERFRVNVPGNPAGTEHYPNGPFVREGASNDTLKDYWLFFPLARNTNMYNINATTRLGRDVTEAEYNALPFDCQFNTSSRSNSPSGTLRLALGADGNPVTPQCGACAPQTCEAQNASLSGFAYVNMATVFERADQGLQTTATLIPAGTVLPAAPFNAANQCAYGNTYRPSKRGGRYIATVADCPQPSIYIVDGSTQRLAGFVPTATRPRRVAYAPPTAAQVVALTG